MSELEASNKTIFDQRNGIADTTMTFGITRQVFLKHDGQPIVVFVEMRKVPFMQIFSQATSRSADVERDRDKPWFSRLLARRLGRTLYPPRAA